MTMLDYSEVPGIGVTAANALETAGYTSLEDIANSSVDELSSLPSIGEDRAEYLIQYSNQ